MGQGLPQESAIRSGGHYKLISELTHKIKPGQLVAQYC